MEMKKEWFEEWFDSPYYHILYKNRDDIEAKKLINNIIKFLKPKKDSVLLDAACGKGRHAIFLSEMGFQVDAFDLSKENIKHAKQFESEDLHFYVNDIRHALKLEYYDYVFNLFTSFGYFKNEAENIIALKAIRNSLKQDGVLVLDFMNAEKVITSIQNEEVKNIDNIVFNISKSYKNGFINKDIQFNDQGKHFHFTEQVSAISLLHFQKYFEEADLKIQSVFGGYDLSKFDKQKSDRLIIVAQK